MVLTQIFGNSVNSKHGPRIARVGANDFVFEQDDHNSGAALAVELLRRKGLSFSILLLLLASRNLNNSLFESTPLLGEFFRDRLQRVLASLRLKDFVHFQKRVFQGLVPIALLERWQFPQFVFKVALAKLRHFNAAMTVMGLDLMSNSDATRFAQQLLRPHGHVVEEDLVEVVPAVDGLDRPHGDAGRVHGHQQQRDAVLLAGFAGGTHQTGRDDDLVPKFWDDGLLIVRAGGEAGLFSAICAGWSPTSRPPMPRCSCRRCASHGWRQAHGPAGGCGLRWARCWWLLESESVGAFTETPVRR